MASIYTYDDFYTAAAQSGLLNQFSKADLALAQRYPEAGMSILQYKKDYVNAADDEQRAAANRGAEQVRSSYGNYKGGVDGSAYYNNGLSPSSFTSDTAPTYTDSYSGVQSELSNAMLNYGSYSYGTAAPEYTNRWGDTIDGMISNLLNREAFSYSAQEDDLYKQYRKQYLREMARASENALGAAASNTGGLASSYAATAAAQAGDYYAAQLTDKIPELYELAYNRYQNEYDRALSNLSVVQGQEQSEYDKYTDALNQWNTDRNFDYNAWLDGYEMLDNNLNTVTGLQQNGWEQYLAALEQYNTDREFAYEQLLDTIEQNNTNRDYDMDFAQTASGYGDNSYLEDLGITVDPTAGLDFAVAAAKYGDYSYLEKLGISPEQTTDLDFAVTAAKYGDYSYLEALGIKADMVDDLDFAVTAAKYGDYSYLRELGINGWF